MLAILFLGRVDPELAQRRGEVVGEEQYAEPRTCTGVARRRRPRAYDSRRAGARRRRLYDAPIGSTRHFPGSRFAIEPASGGFIGRRLSTQISISKFVARGIGEPSVVIPNGVSARPQADLDQPIVLMLQRLQPEKAPLEGYTCGRRVGSLTVAGGC